MGDAVQMSAVLRHVVKHRPSWRIHYMAQDGQYQVGRGIVEEVFERTDPNASVKYDREIQIQLFDTWANWTDRPNTRVSSCLHERFGLAWDPECGRYQVQVRQKVLEEVKRRMLPNLMVAVHYQGDSSPDRKNLGHEQAEEICHWIRHYGGVPLVLDWRGVCPFLVRTTANWPKQWGRNAEVNCAVISQCRAFVGIDSGPGKCASATNTPTLITWTGHHPAPFHDPAPNTTHLVPRGYHGLDPVCNDKGVVDWFEKHHEVREYGADPVKKIRKWLQEVLEC